MTINFTGSDTRSRSKLNLLRELYGEPKIQNIPYMPVGSSVIGDKFDQNFWYPEDQVRSALPDLLLVKKKLGNGRVRYRIFVGKWAYENREQPISRDTDTQRLWAKALRHPIVQAILRIKRAA